MVDVNAAQAILGATFGFGVGVAKNVPQRIRLRKRNAARSKFWARTKPTVVDVIFTGYDVDTVDRGVDSVIAASATSNRLVSTGMARSVAIIQQFCHSDLRASRINVRDDAGLEGQATGDLVVIIGSEANNDLARHYMSRVREEFDMPFELMFSPEFKRVELLSHADDSVYAPEQTGPQVTKDYALVIRARLEKAPSRELLVISGCHMWGTWSAAEAITDSRWMTEALAHAPSSSANSLMVLAADVVQGTPQGANPLIVHELKRRR